MNSYFLSKSAEHDVTLASIVDDLLHPGLPNFNIMCEIDAREDTERFAVIPAVYRYRKKTRVGYK